MMGVDVGVVAHRASVEVELEDLAHLGQLVQCAVDGGPADLGQGDEGSLVDLVGGEVAIRPGDEHEGDEYEGEWMEQEPVNEVVGYGTRITTNVIDTPEGPREYWRVVHMRVTAYTAASSGKRSVSR